MSRARALVLLLLATGLRAEAQVEPVTFNDEVAPILHGSCAPCHRPGGSGPFPLLTYDDARKRARQIVRVTRDRYMPPWLPAPSDAPFVGDRRLSEEQISTFRRWIEDGVREGAGDPPPTPTWRTGWQLGEPDLVVAMPRPYVLPEAGEDVYRNFVLPAPVDQTRYVRAVELLPGNPVVVHHGRIFVDRDGRSRQLDERTPTPGFEGMVLGTVRNPDGMLLGWTPGKFPMAGDDGLAWRLEPDTDLVLQLHMVPGGRPEPVQARIGLYFADSPPTRHPYAFVMGTRMIDIAAGAAAHEIVDEYLLPVDVEMLGIYPHAHYLGKEMTAIAELPAGTRRLLLHIPDWDFNWQDEYRFERPVALPAGTRLAMRYTYDNSAENVRNPSFPPRRVIYGARSVDEMAELAIQVLPRNSDDLSRLERDFRRRSARKAIEYRRHLLSENPRDSESHAAIGSSYLELGKPGQALTHLEAAIRLDPRNARARNNLGFTLARVGRLREALTQLTIALELDPASIDARFNLAETLMSAGRPAQAAEAYRRILATQPTARVHGALGVALRAAGDTDGAVEHLLEAARLEPGAARYLNDAAWLLATHTDPARRRPDEAVRLATAAADLTRNEDPVVLATLAAAYASQGRYDRAVDSGEQALSVTGPGATALADEIRSRLERYRKSLGEEK